MGEAHRLKEGILPHIDNVVDIFLLTSLFTVSKAISVESVGGWSERSERHLLHVVSQLDTTPAVGHQTGSLNTTCCV